MLSDILKEMERMQIKYSPDADVLLVKLREGKLFDSVDIGEGLIAHYAEDGSVLEIEILDASKVVELKDLSFSLEGMLAGIRHRIAEIEV